MIMEDTKVLEFEKLKGLTLLANAKNVFSIVPKPEAKVTVKITVTQTT